MTAAVSESTSRTRTFSVAPSIITHLIRSQAGTLGKAMTECIMNSIDAGASSIDVRIGPDELELSDDGHGFRSRDEILACFEVFGFDHGDNNARTFGKFGLGRGQLWNFAETEWRTNTFSMSVDVRRRGLDYTLSEGLPTHPGLTISGKFYETMSNLDITRTLSEVERLVKYSVIPVSVNGRLLSRAPIAERWDFENEDLWLRLDESSELKVYNQGIYVCSVYSGSTGVAGTLVTKLGRNLELNMARNDVLRAECPIWKQISPVLDAHAKKGVTQRKASLNDAQRDFLATQTSDPALYENFFLNIFTLSNGRNVSLIHLIRRVEGGAELTVSDKGDHAADRLLQQKLAVVLARQTLTRFGVDAVSSLVDLVERRLQSCVEAVKHAYQAHWLLTAMTTLRNRTVNDIRSCSGFAATRYELVPPGSLKGDERSLCSVLDSTSRAVRDVFTGVTQGIRDPALRAVRLAEPGSAEAFTDGKTFIAIDRKNGMAQARAGFPGFVRLTHLLVHEYLHDQSSASSHNHDHEFYEAFHDIILDGNSDLINAAITAFKTYVNAQKRLSLRAAAQLDQLTG